MVHKCCRRRLWVKCMQWTIGLAVLLLLLWHHRSWVVHGVQIALSSSYRDCAWRRHSYYPEVVVPGKKNLYMTMALHGRLGNWMYQYASLLGIAKTNQAIPYFLTGHSLNFYFKLSRLATTSADCLVTVEDPKPLSYVESLNQLPKGNITLDGYFQSWRYFDSIKDEIRKEFEFKDHVMQKVHKKYDNLVGEHVRLGREVISIHVRRGDVTSSGAKRLGFKPAPVKYFSNAIRYMAKRHPFCVFLVFSDDPRWTEKNIKTVNLRFRKTSVENKIGGKILVVSGENNDNNDNNNNNAEEEIYTWRIKNVEKLLPANYNELVIGEEVDLGPIPMIFAPRDVSIIDLGLLTLANHSIVSLGTFGWWGAWLAEGDVVYYDDFLIPDHVVYLQWTKGDFYPSDWIALSAAGSGQRHRPGRCCDWLLLSINVIFTIYHSVCRVSFSSFDINGIGVS